MEGKKGRKIPDSKVLISDNHQEAKKEEREKERMRKRRRRKSER